MAQTGFTPLKIYASSTVGATPSASKLINDTSGSELAINIADGKLFYKDSSGTVQVIATKATAAITYPLAVVNGGTGVTTSTGTGSNVLSISPDLTGTPTAPTATAGTNTTQIATTAFTTAAITAATGSLGSMSTQNANNVAITGGTINGVSGLTVNGYGTFVSPNSGSSGGVQIRQNAGGGSVYLQFTNNAGSAEYGDIGVTPGGVINISPATAGQVQVSGNKVLTTATKLGLGITGEVWNDVTGSRSYGSTYTNSNAYPIMFAVSTTSSGNNGNHQLNMYVNGVLVVSQTIDGAGNTGNGLGGIIVPPGQTYSADNTGSNTTTNLGIWTELY